MTLPATLTGQRFGCLRVLRSCGRVRGAVLWLCRCDCGRERAVITAYLRGRKKVRSCGQCELVPRRRPSAPKRDPSIEAEYAAGASVAALEQRHGLSRATVYARLRAGNVPLRSPPWPADELALLGTLPDNELAARLGRSVASVTSKRKERKIATVRDRRRREA